MREFFKDELWSRFSQEAIEALEDQREILVTEVASEVWRRDEQLYDLRAELKTLQQNQEDAGVRQHMTGLFQETQQYRDTYE